MVQCSYGITITMEVKFSYDNNNGKKERLNKSMHFFPPLQLVACNWEY